MYFDENGNMYLLSDVINGLNGTVLNKTNKSKEDKNENK